MAEKPLKVYAIEDNGGDRKYWREVGVAFKCDDSSLNVKLYMMPLLKAMCEGARMRGIPRSRAIDSIMKFCGLKSRAIIEAAARSLPA